MLSYAAATSSPNHQQQQQQQQDPNQQPTIRLRDEPPAITPAATRKRKSPSGGHSPEQQQQQQQQPPPPPQQQQQQQHQPQHVLPTMMHAMPPQLPPPGFQFLIPGGAEFNPAGLPPPPPQPDMMTAGDMGDKSDGRALSSSKRAEQNRKAQRAFRERRDQHVKALESRSQLLDAALASADEANRRWEECRALVDSLRLENNALRTALQDAQQQLSLKGIADSSAATAPSTDTKASD